jgi:methionyl-tRNA formyltransferase
VVVGWNQIVRPELLAVPHRGCVGFHASLLPRHRGHAPVNWAILRGETETGNTMMLLDPGVDTGDIVDQTRIAIDPGDTCASIYDRVGQTGARMLVSHLAELLDGRAPRHAQSRDKDRPLPRRVPEMGVIDWNRPAREVHDWIRALTDPYPGAFTFLRGKTVMVWEARRPSHNEPVGEPGVVLALGADGLRVGVHAGSIVLNRMSDAGSRPSDAADWAAHARVSVGTRFDPVAPTILAWARSGGPRPAVLA